MEERRSSVRYGLHLNVVVNQMRMPKDSDYIHAITRDIGPDGVYFTSDRSLPVGTKVDLAFTLPTELTHGSVVHVEGRGTVVRVVEEVEGKLRRVGMAAWIDRCSVDKKLLNFTLHKAEQASR